MLNVLAFLIATVTAPPNPANCDSEPTLVTAVPAHVPESEEPELGAGRVTMVEVTIAPDGHVSDARVYLSSGSAFADAASVTAARASTYKPAMKDCHSVADTALIDEVVRPNYEKQRKDGTCRTGYKDASVLRQAPIRFPPAAVGRVTRAAQVTVRIDVDPDGDVTNAIVLRSSGNVDLDETALNAARGSVYAPKVVNCEPITGKYLFRVTFDPTH